MTLTDHPTRPQAREDVDLAPAVTDLLAAVRVDAAGVSATVGDVAVTAKTARDLVSRVSAELYDQVHAGRAGEPAPRRRTLRDAGLDDRLRDALPHRGTVVPVRVLAQEPGDTVVVLLDGLRVAVPRSELSADEVRPGQDAQLRLPAARPALSPGFFLVDGSRGRPSGQPLLRVYLHLPTADRAPAVWGTVLQLLEQHGVRYRAKVSSSPWLYPRRDALVVYLGRTDWSAAELLRAELAGSADLAASTSPLTHPLAPGLSVAWEPVAARPAGRGQLSFGEHRCSVLAEAVVEHAVRVHDGEDDGETLAEAVHQALVSASIDPLAPARNLASPRLTALGL